MKSFRHPTVGSAYVDCPPPSGLPHCGTVDEIRLAIEKGRTSQPIPTVKIFRVTNFEKL
jgi:hypothetical protein